MGYTREGLAVTWWKDGGSARSEIQIYKEARSISLSVKIRECQINNRFRQTYRYDLHNANSKIESWHRNQVSKETRC